VTNQKNNIVGGHQAGGDINITTVSNAPETYMKTLHERYDLEQTRKSEFRDIIEKLEYYQYPIDPEPIGLERKLIMGDRQAEIPEALRAKELFVKLMTRYSLSEAAQLLIAYCLGRIHNYFKARVVPLINRREDADQIDKAVIEQVIHPVLSELGTNFLNLTPQELNGMVYYLTANCFINWHHRKDNGNLPSSA
jgi:hypothetical protein